MSAQTPLHVISLRDVRLKSCSKSHFKTEHQRLGRSDALRLTVVEIISQAWIQIDAEMLCNKELDSHTDVGGELHALYLLCMYDICIHDLELIRNTFFSCTSSIGIEADFVILYDIIIKIKRNTNLMLILTDIR